ncbi:hypothetical protein EVAR_28926_1 [Eumeta japonica]|uniref:Uncharacterized protein n=1 Tax=Eumeta variegata TaxID=151549 RepID=A0A4C1YJJ0_EUMVA|nr:hypothetical protein EVAR_28926_1 [Eumeta japonica]
MMCCVTAASLAGAGPQRAHATSGCVTKKYRYIKNSPHHNNRRCFDIFEGKTGLRATRAANSWLSPLLDATREELRGKFVEGVWGEPPELLLNGRNKTA